jgi:hypothetical protein
MSADPNISAVSPGPDVEHTPRDGYIRITMRRPSDTKPDGYLGAQSSYDPLPGEDWRRGNDLPDGSWSEETVDRIAEALKQIVRGERT